MVAQEGRECQRFPRRGAVGGVRLGGRCGVAGRSDGVCVRVQRAAVGARLTGRVDAD